LPEEDKMEVVVGTVPGEYVGFHPMEHYNRNRLKHRGTASCSARSLLVSKTDKCLIDLMEAFNFAYDASQDPEAVDSSEPSLSIWPSSAPEFRTAMYAYHTQLLQLARRLTGIFALALHLPEDFFDEYVKNPEAGMRVVHYPTQQNSRDDHLGIGTSPQSDYKTKD